MTTILSLLWRIFMTYSQNIKFISTHRIELSKNVETVRMFLQLSLESGLRSVEGSSKLHTLAYKDLSSWSPKKHSEALTSLGNKIHHMTFNIGCPNSVEPMLRAIASGRLKRIKYKSLGVSQLGHFRWDWKIHRLTNEELDVVRRLFDD